MTGGPQPDSKAPPSAPPVALFLAGPTASGKSSVALQLAAALDGEILTVDSMQVYRGLDIGTAKPSPADRARVPHHLLDLVDPREPFDAARWLAHARPCFDEVRARGHRPIFCGGTGLYFHAWFHGLADVPPTDPTLRSRLEATPLAELLRELATLDPATFHRIDPHNPRRIVRAVEILRLTGRPLERSTAAHTRPPESAPIVILRRDPADLRRRIDERVDRMFADGLIDETRHALAAGLGDNRTALQALGYRQVVEFLRHGGDLRATVALVKQRTWQYARRQLTWFRHRLTGTWLDVAATETPAEIARRIAATAMSPAAGGCSEPP